MHAKIISIEEIFDWYLKTIEIKLDRKPVERYIKNGSQKVDGDKLVYDDLIRNILNSVEIKDEEKEHFKNVLENFIEVYKCFTQYIEIHKTSQKQLNFLLAKDMIIPFFALFSSYIFDKHLIILEQLKPDENKKSFQKLLDWAQRNICNQNIKDFLINKHVEDSYKDDNLNRFADERTITNWLSLKEQTTPNKEHLKSLVKYLEDCNKASHLNLYNLTLFSKLFQEVHKKLELIFNKREIELLIEHYYCLLKFYSIKSVSIDIKETEYRIYDEVLNHINPNFINRNNYFDDYFEWIQKVVGRKYISPYKLVKNAFNKNIKYYSVSEKECMEFIELRLPVLYFNKTKNQNLYVKLLSEYMLLKKEELNKTIQKESDNLQMQLFFEHLDIKKEKNHNDKKVCNDIFERLENEFKEDDLNPYICFLKTRYYIFDNNLEEALIYCEKCVNQGIGKLGEHFKEAIMMGILLSAKNNTKTKYNFFRRMAIKYDSLTFGRLKIPAYGRGGTMIDILEDKSSFNELKEQYDEYFLNKFQ